MSGSRQDKKTRHKRQFVARIVFVGAIAVTLGVCVSSGLPLGVPGEWVWQRHAGVADVLDMLDRLGPAAAAGVMLFFMARFGCRHTPSGSVLRTGALLVGLMIAAWCWLWAVQHSAPMLHRQVKPYWVLYDRASAGYFDEAAFHMESPSQFLQDYEDRMNEGDVLHVGTHPPGLFLLSYGVIDLCHEYPVLVTILNATEIPAVHAAFRTIEENAGRPQLLENHELAALHLLSSMTTVCVGLTVIPLFVMLREIWNSKIAWQCCCLWPTLPCLAVFLPKSDLLFPLTCTTVLALMVVALKSRRLSVCAVPAGIVLFLGMLLSLAHLPVVALLVIFAGLRAFYSRGKTVAADCIAVGVLVATVMALSLGFSVVTSCDILAVWKLNLLNHESFYRQFPRTWWKWILVNPVELAFAVGLPVFVVAAAGLRHSARSLLKTHFLDKKPRQANVMCVAAFLTLAALWLSGKNQGEAARLWCFLTPWVLIAVAVRFAKADDVPSQNSDSFAASFDWFLSAQLICAVITVASVSGFSF